MKRKIKLIFAVFVIILYIVAAFFSYNDYENTIDRYSKRGFKDLGLKYDTLIEIHDYHIDETEGNSYITVYNMEGQGLYFESTNVAPLNFYSSVWMREENFCLIMDSSRYMQTYELVNKKTIAIDTDEDAYEIIFKKALEIDDIGYIFEVKEDRFGIKDDKEKVLYFAVRYEELMRLRTNEFGEQSWKNGFSGYEERNIYF